jgi:hypothetical protein
VGDFLDFLFMVFQQTFFHGICDRILLFIQKKNQKMAKTHPNRITAFGET